MFPSIFFLSSAPLSDAIGNENSISGKKERAIKQNGELLWNIALPFLVVNTALKKAGGDYQGGALAHAVLYLGLFCQPFVKVANTTSLFLGINT